MPCDNPFASCDFDAEWRSLQKVRGSHRSAEAWDRRATTYSSVDSPESYVKDFLELVSILPGESVLDMGCGTGALSLPLAAAGHKVIAADFSVGMLGVLADEHGRRQAGDIVFKQMSWADDWTACGVAPGCVDVCIASRSMSVDSLEDALLKLDRTARRRACVTISTGLSPRADARILNAIGLGDARAFDHVYAFNILSKHGIVPEVAYIKCPRKDTFDSFECAYGELARMIDDCAAFVASEVLTAARARLGKWLEDQIVPNEDCGKADERGRREGPLRLRLPREVVWAFVAWDSAEERAKKTGFRM